MKNILSKNYQEKLYINKKSFFELCVWIFILGSLLGFIVEVAYSFIWNGFFVNKQGMIYGPFNQVYGLGAVIFAIFLYKHRQAKVFMLFLFGVLIGSVFEFACSFFQEVIFKSESWSYTGIPLSLNGRINVFHSIVWGLLTILFFRVILPFFVHIFEKIPMKIRGTVTALIFIFMVFNLTLSAMAVYRQAERREGIKANNAVEVFLDRHYNDDYLKKVYPNMKFLNENKENV